MDKKINDFEVGTPSLAFLPARHYPFIVVKKEHKITIPRKGKYVDLDKDFFSEEDGQFNILDNRKKTLFLPSIQKVMLATKQYPDLPPNHLYVPVALIFNKDNVDIIGQVIRMLNINELDGEGEQDV